MTEAIEDIWEGDTLGRKADAEFLINFLLGRLEQRGKRGLSRSYVLNVDAGWGGGKSFFMSRLAKELRQRGVAVAEIDAWQDDHADDPLLSLMSAIEATINPLVKGHRALQSTYKTVKKAGLNIATAAAKGAAKQLLHKLVGESAKAISDEIEALQGTLTEKAQADLASAGEKAIDNSAEQLLQGFEDGKKSIFEFKKQLAKLISQIRASDPSWSLFILVDELDRCRPTYAISLLERIKHLFEVDNVAFVIATDTSQLSESVRAVYGSNFDSKKYLMRFFDRTFHFPEAPVDQFALNLLIRSEIVDDLVSDVPGVNISSILVCSIKAFDALPREARRAVDLIVDTMAHWPRKHEIEMSIMIPLAVGLSTGKLDMKNPSCLPNVASAIQKIPIECNMSDFITSEERNNVYQLGDLIEGLLHGGREFIQTISSHPQNAIARWSYLRLRREYDATYQGIKKVPITTKSIIWSYPQMLSATGRLQSDLGGT